VVFFAIGSDPFVKIGLKSMFGPCRAALEDLLLAFTG
jgi:hypothetical protein